MSSSAKLTNGVTVGLEVTQYSTNKFTTGIQQVISHLYDDLQPFWESRGVHLAPMSCQTDVSRGGHRQITSGRHGARFRMRALVSPEECVIIILPDCDANVDFRRLRALSRQRGIPVIAFVYDLLPLILPDAFPPESKPAFRIYLQQTLSVADHVIVTTNKVKTDLLNLGWKLPANIHVVPLGSRMPQQTPHVPDKNQISIMYISTIEPRKGHDLLLKTFDLLISWGKDVVMTFIGHQGWMVQDLCNAIRNHPEFGSRLRWHLGADDALTKKVAMSSNVGVMPSQGEGFGMFIEEGLSLGLKVVVSAIPEFLERAQPNLFFSAQNPVAFAENIIKAHNTPWIECRPPRSMQDFSYEISQVVESVFQQREIHVSTSKGDAEAT